MQAPGVRSPRNVCLAKVHWKGKGFVNVHYTDRTRMVRRATPLVDDLQRRAAQPRRGAPAQRYESNARVRFLRSSHAATTRTSS